MNETLSLESWLDQEPLPEEIRTNEDGSRYIPIEFIKVKLDYLCPVWKTKRFHHSFFNNPDRSLMCSGNVEIIIAYSEFKEGIIFNAKRTLTGAATFDTQRYYPNTNYAATCLSLSIVSAAKELGRFFGKYLNKEMLTVPSESNVGVDKRKVPDLWLKNKWL